MGRDEKSTMTTRTLTPLELRREGFKALVEHLGPDGALRFLQQFDAGAGDYTQERANALSGLTMDEILRTIRDQATQ